MTAWHIDKSAIQRLHLATNAGKWTERIERDLVRIRTVTRIEIGYSVVADDSSSSSAAR